MEDIVDFFVYGTLKRGECRERCWPRKPVDIQDACVRGCLYDLGSYPAMTPGDDWVLGEIWSIRSGDVNKTLEVLDEIEGFEALGTHNLYDRVTVEWYAASDPGTPPIKAEVGGVAWTYHFAKPHQLLGCQLIEASPQGTVHWSAGGGT